MGRNKKFQTREEQVENKRINAWISHHLKDFLLIMFKNSMAASIGEEKKLEIIEKSKKEYEQKYQPKSERKDSKPEFLILLEMIKRQDFSDYVDMKIENITKKIQKMTLNERHRLRKNNWESKKVDKYFNFQENGQNFHDVQQQEQKLQNVSIQLSQKSLSQNYSNEDQDIFNSNSIFPANLQPQLEQMADEKKERQGYQRRTNPIKMKGFGCVAFFLLFAILFCVAVPHKEKKSISLHEYDCPQMKVTKQPSPFGQFGKISENSLNFETQINLFDGSVWTSQVSIS